MLKGKSNKMVRSSNYLGGIPRTKVHNHYEIRTTQNAGYICPIFVKEIDPAMNESINLGQLMRSITPLGPVMDKSFNDVFWFFVPNRLLWDHWEEFIAGYNKEAWAQDIVYTVPKILFKAPGEGDSKDKAIETATQSFLDYIGYPVLDATTDLFDNVADAAGLAIFNKLYGFSALFPRAYVKIWNDWFRDENLQDELQLYTGDNDEYADEFAFNLLDKTELPKAGKYHNRFTTALPQPQKGPDVLIPMDNLKLVANGLPYSIVGDSNLKVGFDNSMTDGLHNLGVNIDSGAAAYNGVLTGSASIITADSDRVIDKVNLYAKNVSNTIRQLRLATQTELLLARDARGGTRYVESLLSHWSVHNGDARLQRSEYLGSRQIPLQVMSVTNTAESASGALGNVGAQSVTKDNFHYFSKGFTEHGILMCVSVIRTSLSYSHQLRKEFQRFNRFDYRWPEFRHIGDVPLYGKEYDIRGLFVDEATSHGVDYVLGYTPYGSEIREGYNINTGHFRDDAPGSFAFLTYQEQYGLDDSDYAMLNEEFIQQSDAPVYQTLTVQTGPQFYSLYVIEEDSVIPLDPTSDPGLMDHF